MKKLNKYRLNSVLIFLVVLTGILLTVYLYQAHYKKQGENKTVVEKRELSWIQDNAVFDMSMKDGNKEYELYLVGEEETNYNLLEDGPYGEKEDPIVEGNFSFYLWKESDGNFAYKQAVPLQEFVRFNLSQKNIETFIIDQKSVTVVYQENEKEELVAYFYEINEGQLMVLSESGMKVYERKIKDIQQKYLQTVSRLADGAFEISTWTFPENEEITRIDQTIMNNKEIISNWLEDDTFYFPYKNITLSEAILTTATQGMIVGTQYPIGTSVKEIQKTNTEFILEDSTLDERKMDFPEFTYYYDEYTSLVTAISIPGFRVKENMDTMIDTIGEPDELMENRASQGYIATYYTGKYMLQFYLTIDKEIDHILLKRRP